MWFGKWNGLCTEMIGTMSFKDLDDYFESMLTSGKVFFSRNPMLQSTFLFNLK
jgi:hypothetical protein